MAENNKIIPVWFFVGVILLMYGVLILGSGIYQFSNPPSTVLSTLHTPVWWGGLMALIGGIYAYLFRPKK